MKRAAVVWVSGILWALVGCDDTSSSVSQNEEVEGEVTTSNTPTSEPDPFEYQFPDFNIDENSENEGGEDGGSNPEESACLDDSDCTSLPAGQCESAVCDEGLCVIESVPNETPCDDDVTCTDSDVCENGVCVGVFSCQCQTDSDCPVVSACQESVCSSEGSCEVVNSNGASCNDGDPCTTNDICSEGECGGTFLPICDCDDSGIILDGVTGQCSLVEAIEASGPESIIQLVEGEFTVPLINVGHAITILGSGVGETELILADTIAFQVTDGTFVLKNLQLTGGTDPILGSGPGTSLMLENVKVTDYEGIGVQGSGCTLELTNVILSGNGLTDASQGVKLEGGASASLNGGFIENHGGVGFSSEASDVSMVEGLSILNNLGGGVLGIESSFVLEEVTFQSNESNSLYAQGGEVQLTSVVVQGTVGIPGRGVWIDNGQLTLVGSSIESNAGDGLYLVGSTASVTQPVWGNNATLIASNGAAGIAVEGGGTLAVSGGTYEENELENIRVSGGSLTLSDA